MELRDVPGPVVGACVVIALEAAALVAGAGLLLIDTVVGDPDSVTRALVDGAAALIGAAILAVCARGLVRLSPAARTPTIVLQLLALPVSYSLAFKSDRFAYGAPILVAAVAVLFLLFTPPAREALDRDAPH